jgi:hypothetical protein
MEPGNNLHFREKRRKKKLKQNRRIDLVDRLRYVT